MTRKERATLVVLQVRAREALAVLAEHDPEKHGDAMATAVLTDLLKIETERKEPMVTETPTLIVNVVGGAGIGLHPDVIVSEHDPAEIVAEIDQFLSHGGPSKKRRHQLQAQRAALLHQSTSAARLGLGIDNEAEMIEHLMSPASSEDDEITAAIALAEIDRRKLDPPPAWGDIAMVKVLLHRQPDGTIHHVVHLDPRRPVWTKAQERALILGRGAP